MATQQDSRTLIRLADMIDLFNQNDQTNSGGIHFPSKYHNVVISDAQAANISSMRSSPKMWISAYSVSHTARRCASC